MTSGTSNPMGWKEIPMRQTVQALVITAILGIGASLVLPAVAMVRDSARRMQCTNNLRQIGLSLENCHDTQGHFPAAALAGPELPLENGSASLSLKVNRQLAPEKRLSWLVVLVPYIDQNDIYSRLDLKKGWDAEENRFAALMSFTIFHCPGYREGPPTSTLWPSHYVGSAGVGEDALWLPTGDPRAGFFGYDRIISKKDLPRGASETMVAGETNTAQGGWTAADLSTVRGFDPAATSVGGNHGGGRQVVFADGSVRLIAPTISRAVWLRTVVLTAEDNPGQ